jgi:hypothetical protein
VAKKRSHHTIPRESQKGQKGSLGAAEGSHTWTEGQIRTLLFALRKRYPGVPVFLDSDIVTWLIRHVGWLRTKFKVGTDGKTPHTRLFGKAYGGTILEFGECAEFKTQRRWTKPRQE